MNHLEKNLDKCLNESPHPKVGKCLYSLQAHRRGLASMKVPTRRWGNAVAYDASTVTPLSLNESPHPKVGKFQIFRATGRA